MESGWNVLLLLLLLLYELHSKNMTTEKEKMDEIVKVE